MTCVGTFRLFNRTGWEEAEAKLKAACVEAANKIVPVQDECENWGAGDTDSRDAIVSYVWHLLLYPPAKRARDFEAWRQFVIEKKSLNKIAKAAYDGVYEARLAKAHMECDILCASHKLNDMRDAEVMAALNIGPESLPEVREHIEAFIKPDEKGHIAKIRLIRR